MFVGKVEHILHILPGFAFSCYTKYLKKSTFEEKGFILAYSFKGGQLVPLLLGLRQGSTSWQEHIMEEVALLRAMKQKRPRKGAGFLNALWCRPSVT
jgi:hypothetical protein